MGQIVIHVRRWLATKQADRQHKVILARRHKPGAMPAREIFLQETHRQELLIKVPAMKAAHKVIPNLAQLRATTRPTVRAQHTTEVQAVVCHPARTEHLL